MTDEELRAQLRAGIESLVRYGTCKDNKPSVDVNVDVNVDTWAGCVGVKVMAYNRTEPFDLTQLQHLALNVLLGLPTLPGALIDAAIEARLIDGDWERLVRGDERERCAKVVDFHHTLERLAVEAGDGEVRAMWRLEDAAKQIRSEVAS